MSEEPLRIRLPDNYIMKDNNDNKPLTIADYDKRILQPAMKRFVECRISEYELREEYKLDVLFGSKQSGIPYKPPTRWQRFKRRLYDYQQRAKDIWTILRGKDIHEDCGY